MSIEGGMSIGGVIIILITIFLWFFTWQYALTLDNLVWKLILIYGSMALTIYSITKTYLNYSWLGD